jgi:cyclophilin family peptidyl-prolyl cis-trans isomerase/HEAT repeat protein
MHPSSYPVPRVAGRALQIVSLIALMGLAACGDPSGSGPGASPLSLRGSDGLAQDAALQGIVDLQIARDGGSLVDMLTSARTDVRARAALALGSVQDAAALEPLTSLLTLDADAGVRRDAAFAVGQLGATDGVGALARAFTVEADAQVRDRILEALGKIGALQATEALMAAAVTPGEEARRAWALSVNAAVKGVRSQDAQDFLFAKLDDADPGVRAGAAYYFGRHQDPGLWTVRVSRVREALAGYGAEDVAAMYLLQALGKLNDPADSGRLADWAVKGKDWRIRSEATTALAGRAIGAAERNALIESLNDPIEHVAINAANALASTDHPPSVFGSLEAWISANGDRLAVVGPVLTLLARQNEREFVFAWVDAVEPTDERRWTIGLEALGYLAGQDALDRLGAAVASPSQEVGAAAIVALSTRWEEDRKLNAQTERYFEIFRVALTGGNPTAEFASAQRLTDPLFAPFGAADVLVSGYRYRLDAGNARDAAEFLRLIALIDAPEAETLLREALGHPAAVMRRIAASGLERLTGEMVEVNLDEDSEDVRRGSDELPYDPTVMDWDFFGGLGAAPRLVMNTDRGRIVVQMVPEEAPHTVQTMARLAEEGRFDGTPFHRVIANFVAQGGDVDSGTGRGGPGFQITSEFNTLPYWRGSMGMASAGKDTEGSQFFLAHTRLPHLDGAYTVFGWVVEGMGVVDAITRGDRILTASLERD